MLSWLNPLNIFIDPLIKISDKIADTRVKLAQETNNEKRIVLEETIKGLETRKGVILQAQKDPFERWIRIGFALPFIIYIWKLIFWDKVLALGVTDPLSTDLTSIMFIVLGGYFVDTIVKRFKG